MITDIRNQSPRDELPGVTHSNGDNVAEISETTKKSLVKWLSEWPTTWKAGAAVGFIFVIGVANQALQIRSGRRALLCGPPEGTEKYCSCPSVRGFEWCKWYKSDSKVTESDEHVSPVTVLESKKSCLTADTRCCPCCCSCCSSCTREGDACKPPATAGNGCCATVSDGCKKMCKETCTCVDECYCDNKLCCVATWCCSLWTAIGVLAMPIGHMFMYGGNKSCDCEPDRCGKTCDVGKDWYTEDTFKEWVAKGGPSTEFKFDNALDAENDTFTMEQIDLIQVQKEEGYNMDLRNVDHQYAFKLMTGDVSNEAERTPVIIAGGRGSDVSNLWDQKDGKVLDISDFPDSDNYVFYSMDYPGYGATNPQDAGILPGFEDNILQDYKALFDYVQVKNDKSPLLSGVSLGAGVVQGLAEKIVEDPNTQALNEEISGMLLINPFKTGKKATLEMFGGVPKLWSPFLSVVDEWDSASRMANLAKEDVPTLVYSSIDDKVIKSSHHRDLFEIAAGLEKDSTPKKLGATYGKDETKLLIQAAGGHKDLDLFGLDHPESGEPNYYTTTPIEHKHELGSEINDWFKRLPANKNFNSGGR